MKVYISGPISGKDINEQMKMFETAEICCKTEFGFDTVVFNPFKFTEQKEEKDWGDYMIECLPVLKKCDVIIMLPFWEDSKGSSIEYDFAMKCGLKAYFMDPLATKDHYFFSDINNDYGFHKSPCNECSLARMGMCSYTFGHQYECSSFEGYLKLIR